MSKVLRALVTSGRYQGQTVRISNISADELGRQNAACTLADGTRANIKVCELSLIEDKPDPESEVRRARTSSMPFVSGSSSSRTLTHTKNMGKNRPEVKPAVKTTRHLGGVCESCGGAYNVEERKGMPGKLTECEACAEETVSKMEGKMIFSHKTGATIEIKKDGELRHQADTFDPKNKS
ncbi:MAG TPA: hypothetical protein VNJ01_14890 [Bacteriovoracaceae bacterium]|nr:hypothetical protein [Bacteriovoracaceae bacterium]